MANHTVTRRDCVIRERTYRDPIGGADAVLVITPPIVVGKALLAVSGPNGMSQRINIEHLFSDEDATYLIVAMSGTGTYNDTAEAVRVRIDVALRSPHSIFHFRTQVME